MQELGAGLGARACNGCVHARLHGNVDSRQRFLGYVAGRQGTRISLIAAAIARRLSNIGFDFAFA